MKTHRLEKEQWQVLSEDAHHSVFGKKKPVAMERVDFALLCVDEENVPAAYVTCRENDSETVYWQFGGAFPGTINTIKSFRAMEQFLSYCSERYKRVVCLVENTNRAMLKFALRTGFRIQGVRYHDGGVLLEHVLEF